MKIKINYEEKTIENVRIGDIVETYDFENDVKTFNKVTHLYNPVITKQNQFTIKTLKGEFNTSSIHPFFVADETIKNGSWIETASLKEGMTLIDDMYNLHVINEIKSNNNEQDETYYDFTVQDTHNYYVNDGNNNYVLTHNSATCHVPIWHSEIQEILVLKNNKGTDDNRVRKMDYSIGMSKLFYSRFINNENITLFCPNDVPGLYEAFGDNDKFDELYAKYEKDKKIPKKVVPASEIILSLIKERAETGRIYITNIDHMNSHSSFLDPSCIKMSNLCQEITLPTKPMESFADENGLIATCILSALNVAKIKPEEMEEICDIIVRSLDELIDYQTYPVKAAELYTKKYRSLGVGFIGFAHWLARNKVKYEDKEALPIVHEMMESVQYYLIKASVGLAKEKGKCEGFNESKYSQAILPIDTYKRDIDDLVAPEYKMDWEALREDIRNYGMRHTTLTAIMPSESSSIISNETNGIEPPRNFLSVKQSKKGALKQIVPQYNTLKNYYTLLWEQTSTTGYINIAAVLQKFIDQAISTNTSYSPALFENSEIPTSVFAKDLLICYKYGIKTLYYHQTNDNKKDSIVDDVPVSQIDNVDIDDDGFCESCSV